MSAKKPTVDYVNNPFYVGLNGLNLLFNKALGVAIFGLVLIGLGMLSQFADFGVQLSRGEFTMSQEEIDLKDQRQRDDVISFFQTASFEQYVTLAVIVATVVFVLVLIGLFIYGVFEYTAAKLSEDKNVSFNEAAMASLRQLVSLLWLNIVVTVKVLLWSLLLIVPGIIMAVRYSLSGTVLFREGLKGNAATKRSAELTKGAWFTTVGSHSLWNLITFGTIQTLLLPGTNAVLYKQFASYTDSNMAKPPAHWLSWLAFFLPPLLFILLVGFFVFLFVLLVSVSTP